MQYFVDFFSNLFLPKSQTTAGLLLGKPPAIVARQFYFCFLLLVHLCRCVTHFMLSLLLCFFPVFCVNVLDVIYLQLLYFLFCVLQNEDFTCNSDTHFMFLRQRSDIFLISCYLVYIP